MLQAASIMDSSDCIKWKNLLKILTLPNIILRSHGVLYLQEGELEKPYNLYQEVGSVGLKFVLPLFDDAQNISYKRNSRCPAKPIVAETWTLFSWCISIPWKTNVKKNATKTTRP